MRSEARLEEMQKKERRGIWHIDNGGSLRYGPAWSWHGCVMMDKCRMVALSGSWWHRRQLGLARSMRQYNSEDESVEDGGGGL